MGNCSSNHHEGAHSVVPTELKNISLTVLQAEFGKDFPKFTIQNFENWGKTQKPGNVFKISPTTVEEVQKIVKVAGKHNLKVRAVGSTHSWSPLYPDEGNILIDGKGLVSHNGKPIVINEGHNGVKTVTITSGVTMQEVIKFFDEKKLCFPSNVILRPVTCAGIVSTGCHGVGRDQLCVSDWITAVTLVDSKGEIREFTQEHHADVMKAVQVSLGMFGIFITVTMKVQDQFLVRTDNLFPRMMEFFFDPEHLRAFVKKNWSVEMFWFPFNSMEIEHLDLLRAAVKGKVTEFFWNPMIDKLWVRAINPIKKKDLYLPPGGKDYRRDFTIIDNLADKMLQYTDKLEHFLDDLGGVGKAVDKFIHGHFDPVMLYLSFKTIVDEYYEAVGICEDVTHAIHYRTYKDLVPVYDMSFAFNCPDTEDGFYKACKAITKVVELVQRNAKLGNYPLSTTMEMRWISHSNTLLAPAIIGQQSGYTLYLEILSFEHTEMATTFFKEVAHYWMTQDECHSEGVKPLPHWGKMWSFIPGINQYLREGYGDNMKSFKNIREQVNVDPDNMFTNGKLEDIFELHV